MASIVITVLLSLAVIQLASIGWAAAADHDAAAPRVFSSVNGEAVYLGEYMRALRLKVRNAYYHGAIPEAEREQVEREVAQDLIDSVLLAQEARKHELQFDHGEMDRELQRMRKELGDSELDDRRQAFILKQAEAEFTRKRLVETLRADVERNTRISDDEVRRFYADNQAAFTEPDRPRVSVIMFKVDPSSPSETWQMAQTVAESVLLRLREDADFAGLAREYSDDLTAGQGGDMGYIHRGMLGESAQKVIDKLALGEVSEVVYLLEGYAIFKLVDLQPRALRSFDEVRERVRAVALEQKQELSWTKLLESLRLKAKIEIDESVFTTQSPASSGS